MRREALGARHEDQGKRREARSEKRGQKGEGRNANGEKREARGGRRATGKAKTFWEAHPWITVLAAGPAYTHTPASHPHLRYASRARRTLID